MPLVETTNGPIWYADHRRDDARPVLLLIHGAGGTHLDWPAELRRLREANVIAADLPGHGRSSGVGRQNISAYASDMAALLDALDIPQAVLMGHSMGGAIALTMALNYPDRTRGIVVVGSGARLGVHPDILNGLLTETVKTVTFLVSCFFSPAASDSMRRRSYLNMMKFSPTLLFNDYAACNVFDLREQVDQIQAPTLIFGGTEDRMTPFKFSEYLHRSIAGSQLVRVEGGGHFMMLEQPAFVAEAAGKWLLEQYS